MIGIILAGGRATRMGGSDKGLCRVGDATILSRVVATMRAQCEHVIINGPGGAGDALDLPRVPDDIAGHQGPLAGVLAGLDYVARHHPDAPFVVTVPTDTPFLPADLVARLQDARVADRAEIVCAASGGKVHPVVALWSVALRDGLRSLLVEDGVRRLSDVLARHAVAHVAWPSEPVDPFFNVNAPDDLVAAERMLGALA